MARHPCEDWHQAGVTGMRALHHIFACTTLSEDEKADILGRTAAKLFNFAA